MSTITTLAVLLSAAVLEAGGDAVVRTGLHRGSYPRAGLFVLGAIVLFSYGYVVNTPPWDFGRLLGVYVVLFFIVAQLISWLAFHQPPTTGVLVGGAFVVAGGVILTVWKP